MNFLKNNKASTGSEVGDTLQYFEAGSKNVAMSSTSNSLLNKGPRGLNPTAFLSMATAMTAPVGKQRKTRDLLYLNVYPFV